MLTRPAQPEPQVKPKPRSPAHYLWAALIAHIFEVFPLICPMCASQMRIIAFITFSADVHKFQEYIGVDSQAPRITPARRPPLWEGEGAQETGRVLRLYQTGIWQLKHRQTTPKTSAQVGESQRCGKCGDNRPPG